MAELPAAALIFEKGCPDCASRLITLPGALPQPGDDFDWLVRDYDGFRAFMMEELAARFSERTRWTPADMEVVIVEALAVVLDQLSDMLDRTASEGFLATARRPQSVRRLLKMIGFDAVQNAFTNEELKEMSDDGLSAPEELEKLWLRSPHLMEAAREEGPRQIHTPKRMVTASDYAERLEDHPLVKRAVAWTAWNGSWEVVHVAVRNVSDLTLEQTLAELPSSTEERDTLEESIEQFHDDRGLRLPDLAAGPSLRVILQPYVDAYRMAGREVCLQDGEPVGISLSLVVKVASNYFQSEVRNSILQALGTGVGGFFEAGRLAFGEDLHASDLFETVMALDGVEAVCLNRFKRIGRQYPNQADSGVIRLEGLEYAICDRIRAHPERGYLDLKFHGGRKG